MHTHDARDGEEIPDLDARTESTTDVNRQPFLEINCDRTRFDARSHTAAQLKTMPAAIFSVDRFSRLANDNGTGTLQASGVPVSLFSYERRAMKCCVCFGKDITVICTAGPLCSRCEWEAKCASRPFREDFLRQHGLPVKKPPRKQQQQQQQNG